MSAADRQNIGSDTGRPSWLRLACSNSLQAPQAGLGVAMREGERALGGGDAKLRKYTLHPY